MGETRRAIVPCRCSDCGVWLTLFTHVGTDFVPEGTVGRFCVDCNKVRVSRFDRGLEVLPLGVTEYVNRLNEGFVQIKIIEQEKKNCREIIELDHLITTVKKNLGFDAQGGVNGKAVCEFEFSKIIDRVKTDELLNELRRKYPFLTIECSQYSHFVS